MSDLKNKVVELLKEKGLAWVLTGMVEYVRMMPREDYIVRLQYNLEKALLEYNQRYDNAEQTRTNSDS